LAARSCDLLRDSKAQAEQIRAVAVERLHARVGRVPPHVVNRIDDMWVQALYNETHIDEPAGTKTMGVAEIPDDAPTPNIAESSEEQDDLGRLPLVVACLIDILPSSGEHISARQARSFCKAFEVMMKVGYADRLE